MAGRWSNKYFLRTTEAEYKSRKYQLKKKKKKDIIIDSSL